MVNVLVLDDIEQEARFIHNVLLDSDFTSYFTTNSSDAFEIIKSNHIDILVIDVSLGEEKTGVELIPDFKEIKPNIIPIIITSENTSEIIINALRVGAFDYIFKPLEAEIIEQRIKIASNKVQLEEKSRQLSKVLLHDLTQPLSSIDLFLGYLEKYFDKFSPDNTKLINKTHMAKFDCKKAFEYINNMLEVEELEADKKTGLYETVNLKEIIDKEITILSLAFPDLNINLDLKDDKLSLKIDTKKIKHVIANLLITAFHHLNNTTNINITAYKTDEKIIFQISFQGTMIPEGEENKIFDKDYSVTSNQSSRFNFALSLSYCKWAIESMNGKIWAETDKDSSENKFIFEIPINS